MLKYPMTVEELNEYLSNPKHSTLTVAILWLTQNLPRSQISYLNADVEKALSDLENCVKRIRNNK